MFKAFVHNLPNISGLKININIRLCKYYIWVLINIENNNSSIILKYWPINWWEGTFINNNLNIQMNISGDCTIITPFNIKTIDKEYIKQVSLF